MAQLVEQLIRNQQVTGSSPVTSSKILHASVGFFYKLGYDFYNKPLNTECDHSVFFRFIDSKQKGIPSSTYILSFCDNLVNTHNKVKIKS